MGDDRFAGHERNSLYTVKFDGFISDHKGYCVIGGNVEDVETVLRDDYQSDIPAGGAVKLGRRALDRGANESAGLGVENLEVCLLERDRSGRKFRRLSADEVTGMLES